jgi:mannose-6-phosphate isomerase-like protein (cupin superfamily)
MQTPPSPGTPGLEAFSQSAAERSWEPLFPDFGDQSPLLSILRADSETGAAIIMLKFPSDFHFPKHTHLKAETTFLVAGTHYFEDSDAGKIFRIDEQGYFYLPPHHVHQAWVKAGSLLVAVLDGGAQIDWVDPAPVPGNPVVFPE